MQPLVGAGGPFVWYEPDETGGRGPLAGWAFAVKDLIAIAGRVRSDGSASRGGDPPQRDDATVVARLRSAGARVVGATALHELACGVTGLNDHLGTPTNPAAPGRVPGGSSSGSAAAVAAGLARAALGTDTGGSVRIPSALCGVVGWKPARGIIPLDGVTPCAPSLDHVGVHARTVADVLTVLGALGVDTHTAPTPHRPRLGLDEPALERADATVAAALRAALSRLAAVADIVPVAVPAADEVARVSTTILLSEFASVHAGLAPRQRALLGADIAARLERGAAYSEAERAAARRGADELTAQVGAVLAGVDAVVGPTVPVVPPTQRAARGEEVARRLVTCTRLANVTGHPAVTLPLDAMLPVGLQLLGRDDAALALVAGLVEANLALR